ncbi:calcium homeostasis modulator protein 5-like [Oculina patagonica]
MNTLLSNAAVLFRNSKRSLLYGSMAALTIGLEELIESVVFQCPCEGHFAYGLAFLWAPAFFLFLAGILIDEDLWKVAKPPARRYLKAFLATPYIFINAGIAPAAWLVLSFLQQKYYTCAYFGPSLDSDVIVSNTTDKCHVNLGFRSRELEENYKARSQIAGWSLLTIAVCILFTSVCIRRCVQNKKELKMPSLEYYRYKEAEEALKQFHATAKEIAKQNAKEKVEMLFQNAEKKASDARIKAVSHDVNSKYGMFFVIPSPGSPAFTAPEVVDRPPQFPVCGCETVTTDGPQIPKSKGDKKPCCSLGANSAEHMNSAICDFRNLRPAVSRVRLYRQIPLTNSV